MAGPGELAEKAMAWIEREVKPMIASVAAQGKMNAVEAMDVTTGIEYLRNLLDYWKVNGEAIKAMLAQQRGR